MSLTLSDLKKVYFCTGARNHELLSPLTINTLDFEYDERMASFKALGFIKSSLSPVAVCTTSGTAVAECIPAMLEAFYSKMPLVLISGDRPKKLHGTGSPQTIDHESLTRSCRGSYYEMNLAQFLELKLENPQYPVHINVLIDDTAPHDKEVIHHQDISCFKKFLKDKEAPLFLFSHEEKSMLPFIEKFTQYRIPFYAESMSGGRHLSSIQSERQLIKLIEDKAFDCVIRIGFTPLSKIWRLLEKDPLPVLSFDSRAMSALSYGEVAPFSSQDLLQHNGWWSELEMMSSFGLPPLMQNLSKLIAKYPHSEVSHMQMLHESFQENDIIYLGNSLIIRFFELVQKKKLEVHGNRGVNGIDGQLATAIGLAQGSKKTVYCILGDVTTLYDLSSMREMPENLKLIIMNNKGGRIFEMLKLDQRIVMEHTTHFKDLAEGMKLTYSNIISELSQVRVLELFPNQTETKAFLEEWNK
jgi:2-succinyl-5-enolpyruvyl-6-hydroxy-3-cyclohexene-1-carboxylate synthase